MTFSILGVPINLYTQTQAVETAISRLKAGEGFNLCTFNLDHLVKIQHGGAFSDAYATADMVTADGFPIVWLGKLKGYDLERVTGSDLIKPLCERAATEQLPVFLFGSSTEALGKCANKLQAAYPDLDIAGSYAPAMGFSTDSPDAQEAVKRMRDSGAKICLVALGAPRQELFSAWAQEQLPDVGFFNIGAGLDFIAGTQVRAPRLVQKLNAEWLWRLLQNPKRMANRYGQGIIAFARLLPKALNPRASL